MKTGASDNRSFIQTLSHTLSVSDLYECGAFNKVSDKQRLANTVPKHSGTFIFQSLRKYLSAFSNSIPTMAIIEKRTNTKVYTTYAYTLRTSWARNHNGRKRHRALGQNSVTSGFGRLVNTMDADVVMPSFPVAMYVCCRCVAIAPLWCDNDYSVAGGVVRCPLLCAFVFSMHKHAKWFSNQRVLDEYARSGECARHRWRFTKCIRTESIELRVKSWKLNDVQSVTANWRVWLARYCSKMYVTSTEQIDEKIKLPHLHTVQIPVKFCTKTLILVKENLISAHILHFISEYIIKTAKIYEIPDY